MLIWKEVIRPRTYVCQDKDGKPFKVPVTQSAIKHLYETGQDMLKAGLSIPVPLEHQPLKPMTEEEKKAAQLKNNAGWTKKFDLRNGRLFALLDIQDPEVEKKLPKTIKWTSPHFDSFVDGNGVERNGVISHIALTLRPRATAQEPFGEALKGAASLLNAPAKSFESAIKGGLSLSLSRLLTKKTTGWALLFPAYFAAEGKMEEETTEETTEEKPEDTPEMPEETMDDDLDMFMMLKETIEAMFDIQFPEGTTEENLPERFLKLSMEKKKSETAADATGAAETKIEEDKPSSQPIIEESQPMYMSLTEIQKANDPVKTALAKTLFGQAEKDRNKRIERLKKLNAGLGEKLAEQAKTASLSLMADGSGVYDPMAGTLEALEILESGMAKMSTDKALTQRIIGNNPREEPHPTDEMSKEKEQEAVSALTRSMPKQNGTK